MQDARWQQLRWWRAFWHRFVLRRARSVLLDLAEFVQEVIASFCCSCGATRGIGLEPRSFSFAILQRFNPRAKLTRNAQGLRPQAAGIRCEALKIRNPLQEAKHRAHLASRTARDIYKKLSNSSCVPRSNPSAILFEIETVARSIWSRKPPYPRRSPDPVRLKIFTASSIAAFHTGRSSNRRYCKESPSISHFVFVILHPSSCICHLPSAVQLPTNCA
jgi:hypothetical protein